MSTVPRVDELEAAIAGALQPFEEVRVAYLFGSRARGRARADSDLDIALHVGAAMGDEHRATLLLSIIAALTDRLGALGERADLLELDRAGSGVAFAVIRDGKCVLCRDQRERVRLEARIARRYDDERPYRDLFHRAALRTAERMGKASRG
jgi:predicted nucleotidyltransferase